MAGVFFIFLDKKEMKQVRPLFTLDRRRAAHFCLQESLLSAIVIALYVVLTDVAEEYIVPAAKWQQYLIRTIVMFVASFLSIAVILTIFGYDCGTKKNKKK